MKFDPFKRKAGRESRETASEEPLAAAEKRPAAAERRPADGLSDELTHLGYEIPEADFSILEPDAGSNKRDAGDTGPAERKDAAMLTGPVGKKDAYTDTDTDSAAGNAAGDDGGQSEDGHGLKKAGKKAAAAGAAGLAAISLMLGSAFSNPSEVINQTSPERERPAVVVQYEAQPDDDVILEDEEDEKKKKSFKDIIRNAVYSLPLAARVLLVLPLWVLGYGLIAALTALYEPVLAPLLGVIIKWLLVALVLAASVFFITKAIAPDTPLSKIFSKRNLILILISGAVLGAADHFAMTAVDGYEKWRNLVSCAAGLLILAAFTARLLIRKTKKKAAVGT